MRMRKDDLAHGLVALGVDQQGPERYGFGDATVSAPVGRAGGAEVRPDLQYEGAKAVRLVEPGGGHGAPEPRLLAPPRDHASIPAVDGVGLAVQCGVVGGAATTSRGRADDSACGVCARPARRAERGCVHHLDAPSSGRGGCATAGVPPRWPRPSRGDRREWTPRREGARGAGRRTANRSRPSRGRRTSPSPDAGPRRRRAGRTTTDKPRAPASSGRALSGRRR